jgi:methylenetetrahydrofolate dehydrogenase (NADP+) / methenyltetrahydrofolate cyclohydrolase
MTKILDGRIASQAALNEVKSNAEKISASRGYPPHLTIILIGNDGASETYVANKQKLAAKNGIKSTLIRFDNDVTEQVLLGKIDDVNSDTEIDGLIVQSPIPGHIPFSKVTDRISPAKDVDGFHPINTGKMVQNIPSFVAATPKGIIMLLDYYNVPTNGKKCAVIGRSNIVGMPVSILLARNANPGNCTVTICHSKTINIASVTKDADIIIAALGIPGFLTGDMVKDGAAVIDVGITRVADAAKKSGYRLAGDVDYANVAPKCSFITPVPGGVGPMTIAGLLSNTIAAANNEYYPN